MSSPHIDRAELLREVALTIERLGARSTLFTSIVAAKLGINATDFECLDLLGRIGPLTAGQLAEQTGLTTGAITGVLDRLERAGYAERVRDTHDRRKVIVRAIPGRMDLIGPLFASLSSAAAELNERYSDAELALILDYASRSAALLETEAAKLQMIGEQQPQESRHFNAPLGTAREGRLVFGTGAAATTLRGGDLGDRLLRARFSRQVPDVSVDGGTINVRYRNVSFLSWLVFLREPLAALELTNALPWTIEFRGGVSKLDADLRGLELHSIDIGGGASDVQLTLPRPVGMVPIRISGGASDVYVVRPRGVAVRLHVHDGVGQIALDERRLHAVGGETHLETPAASDTDSTYDITIGGGAYKVVVRYGE